MHAGAAPVSSASAGDRPATARVLSPAVPSASGDRAQRDRRRPALPEPEHTRGAGLRIDGLDASELAGGVLADVTGREGGRLPRASLLGLPLRWWEADGVQVPARGRAAGSVVRDHRRTRSLREVFKPIGSSHTPQDSERTFVVVRPVLLCGGLLERWPKTDTARFRPRPWIRCCGWKAHRWQPFPTR